MNYILIWVNMESYLGLLDFFHLINLYLFNYMIQS